jgi:dTDP-4-amino-4,6-dideoxygalactose transaminase
VTIANATLGLFAAMRAVGVKPGDEVIMPPCTFVATATAALLAGARPVFADVDPDTLLIDPDSVAARLSERTAAVVPVHLAGGVVDVDEIRAVIPDGLPLVEDAAQAIGASLRGRPAGSLGDVAVFSFQSSKTMTAGEGGAVVTDDERIYQAAWSIANVGRVQGGGWYEHPSIGWNLRMTEFQSALLADQLDTIDEAIERRTRATRRLGDLLVERVRGTSVLPDPPGTTSHGRYLAMIRFDPDAYGGTGADAVSTALQAEGIPAIPCYPLLNRDHAIRRETAAIDPRAAADDSPAAQSAERTTLWLPQNVLLADDADLVDVVTAFAKVQRVLSAR